jgi:hypothetical protein
MSLIPLTSYDKDGVRWTTCRTIQLVPQYPTPRDPWQPRRPRAESWRLFDLVGHEHHAVPCYNLDNARVLAAEILAARPTLPWEPWSHGVNTRSYETTARTPGGNLAFAWVTDYCEWGVGGKRYRVGYRPDINLGARVWLSPIAHRPHRMANTLALATAHILRSETA